MIPIQLSIEGLYSYQERQTIDFNYLTEAGLFGIFGATGSGKSSILEAVSYVLYGQVERLKTNVKRTYNMMNLKSNRAYLEFDFINYENKKYRVTREFKRNSQNFEKIATPIVVFYEWINGNWSPLEHSDAEKVIGLSYENFKRTIIIPQGQFKEFIELGARNRSQMMMEIFNLQKFDLQDKASQLRSANRSELDRLEGLLENFEEINAVTLKSIQEKLEAEKQNHQQQAKTTQSILKNYQEYLSLREESKVYQNNLLELEKLDKSKAEIEELRLKINRYELVKNNFSELINRRKHLTEVIQDVNELLETKQKEFNQKQSLLEQAKKGQIRIKDYFDKLDWYKQKVVDLENILKIKSEKKELLKHKERLIKGTDIIKESLENLKKKEEKAQQIEKDLTDLKKLKVDSSLIIQIADWYSIQKNLLGQLINIREKEKGINENLETEIRDLKNLGLNPLEDIDKFEKKTKVINGQVKRKQELLNHLQLEQKLSEYADALHDGEACPLCGSLDHPHVHSGRDVSLQITTITNEIEAFQKNLEEINNQKNRVQKFIDVRKIFQNQLEDNKQESHNVQNQIKTHLQLFKWPEYDPDNIELFEKQKLKNAEIEKSIKEKETEYKVANNETDELRKQTDRYKNEIGKIETEITKSETSLKFYSDNLKNIKLGEFENIDSQQIEAEKEQLISKNEQIDKDYKQFEQDIIQLNNQLSAIDAELKINRKRLEEVTIQEKSISEELLAGIMAKGFQSVEEVSLILSLNLDVEALRKRVDDFNLQYFNLTQKINEQKLKLKDFKDSEELFKAKDSEAKEAETALAAITKQLTQTETESVRLQKEFDRKKVLLKTQTRLQKRQENLTTIFNLLRGKAFVEYVSTIYLRQLCDNANTRFHRMTRNQLSLQLNDNNDFEVIDYLNEGRSRSVKTLSGGQAFQVSLSLALALAESVQSHNQSQQNFFFIDEGFGTQDTESVNIVFDTLLQLHKENRIVGIISHVDELKERIPRALQITKDEEKGSRISVI